MRPLALAREVIASSFRFRGVAGASRNRLRRAPFLVCAQRYAKGAAAASWDEAANIYFSKGSKAGLDASSVDTVVAESRKDRFEDEGLGRKGRIGNARRGRNAGAEEAEFAVGSKQSYSGEREDSGLSFKVRKKGSVLAKSAEDDEEVEDGSASRRKSVPEGIQRLKRGGQVRRGFPVLDRVSSSRDRYRERYIDEDKPSEVPQLRGEALYGLGPIRAALQARRRDLHVLYVQEKLDEDVPSKKKPGADVKWIMKTAKSLELTILPASKHVLNMLADNRPHQGMVLDASPLELVEMKALEPPLLLGGKAPVWVALDEVQDPQNFGAILRSAYFFGAAGAVVCAKNSAPLSGVVSKASAGALEVMELLYCRNMMRFLQESVANGWRAVGTSPDSDCTSISDIPKNVPTILVLGNEGVGVRTNVMLACSHFVRISGVFSSLPRSRKKSVGSENSKSVSSSDGKEGISGEEPKSMKAELTRALEEGPEVDCALGAAAVDSLNVSVAAGILLHELINHATPAPSPSVMNSTEEVTTESSLEVSS